jgi:proteasome lid subunit RPN8/RPN11
MKKVVEAQLCLSRAAQEAILSDIYSRNTIEACGVLLGTVDEQGNWHVEEAHPLRNVFNSPVYFEFDPQDLLLIDLNYPGQMIGVYHSHPTGFPIASDTDRQNMQRVNREQRIPWVWLIVSGPFNEHNAWLSDTQVAKNSMIAYHHYIEEGLQQIEIQLERPQEK